MGLKAVIKVQRGFPEGIFGGGVVGVEANHRQEVLRGEFRKDICLL